MQEEMRKSTGDDFPKVDFFKRLKRNLEDTKEEEKKKMASNAHFPDREKLDVVENVGKFAVFLLRDTSEAEYSSQDWDIRDADLAKRWVVQ